MGEGWMGEGEKVYIQGSVGQPALWKEPERQLSLLPVITAKLRTHRTIISGESPMMEFERLKQDILTLPEDAQRLVNDFVALLKQRYPTRSQEGHQVIDLDQEPFVGTWCDRSDMVNSSAWVKQVRQQHWHR